MAYLGKTPSQAVRSRYYFTATGGETSLSGTDDNSNTLTFSDGNYVDVSLNGVALVAGTDYNTTTTNTIGGLSALTASDVVEVIVYDTFSVFSGNFSADIDVTGTVTADGLTVDGGITTTVSGVALDVAEDTASSDAILGIKANGSDRSQIRSTHTLGSLSDLRFLTRDGSTTKDRIKIGSGGDISFYADNGTSQGLYWDASTERLGLGTTTPVQVLDVRGGNIAVSSADTYQTTVNIDNTDTNGRHYGLHSTGSNNTAGRFRIYDYDANAERMTITSGGNVGIGTASPSSIFHTEENTTSASVIRHKNTSNTSGAHSRLIIQNGGTSGGDALINLDTQASGSRFTLGVDRSASKFVIANADKGSFDGSNEAFVITSGGDVLVNGGKATIANSSVLTENLAVVANNDTSAQDNGLAIYRSIGDDKIVINPQGGAARFIADGGSTHIPITFHRQTGSTLSENGRFDPSGNLLVGRTNAFASTATSGSGSVLNADGLFEATKSGTVAMFNRNTTTGRNVEFRQGGSIVGDVSTTASGATYNTTSDIRLKTDIAPIADATETLMSMNAVTHKWKAEPDADAVVGFIAQEMAEIVPEAVSKGDSEDDMWSMDYGRITPVLVAALQDAHKKIEQLEQRIAEMETE